MVRKRAPKLSGRQNRVHHARAARNGISNFYNRWEPFDDVAKRTFDFVKRWELVRVELGHKLKSGQIRSLVRAVDVRSDKPKDQKLPTEFWRETTLDSVVDGLRIRWDFWLQKKRQKEGVPNWWPSDGSRHFSHHFFLSCKDVHGRLANQGALNAGHEIELSRRKPGPEPRYNWPIVVAAEFIRRFTPPENIPRNETRLAEEMLQFCDDKWKWSPPDAAMRRHLKDLLKRARNLG